MKEQANKTYKHLGQFERDRIQSLLDEGVKPAAIARIIGRDKATVGREIRRNKRVRGEIKVKNKQQYDASSAQLKARVRRQETTHNGKKIEDNLALRAYVIQGLKRHWNPDEIAGALKLHQSCQSSVCTDDAHGVKYVSKTAIYEWLYSPWGQAYCELLATKRTKAKLRKPKAKKTLIPDRVSITERPVAATERTEYGHYEGDTIVSGKKTGSTAALVVTLERKARYGSLRVIPDLKPESFTAGAQSIQATLASMASLSMDNGIENRNHRQLGVPTFFCDPYSSWQKGGVEHFNKMVRRYVPKGTNLATVTQEDLDRIASIINNKPRKILGYESALQVMQREGLLVQTAT